jgi:hypothetical protein
VNNNAAGRPARVPAIHAYPVNCGKTDMSNANFGFDTSADYLMMPV